MELLQLLNANGFISVNKQLIKEIGLEPAVVFGEIVSKYYYHKGRGELRKGGWFYFTVEKMEEVTSLSKYKQKKAINSLIEIGLIEQNIMGVPSKRHFRPCKSTLLEFLATYKESESPTRGQKTSEVGSKKLATYSTYKNKNKNKDNNFSSHSKKEQLENPEYLKEHSGWN